MNLAKEISGCRNALADIAFDLCLDSMGLEDQNRNNCSGSKLSKVAKRLATVSKSLAISGAEGAGDVKQEAEAAKLAACQTYDWAVQVGNEVIKAQAYAAKLAACQTLEWACQLEGGV